MKRVRARVVLVGERDKFDNAGAYEYKCFWTRRGEKPITLSAVSDAPEATDSALRLMAGKLSFKVSYGTC